jgi:hypothetical protein
MAGPGDHPAFYPVDTGGFGPAHETDHLPPSSAEAENVWRSNTTPHMCSWHETTLPFVFI